MALCTLVFLFFFLTPFLFSLSLISRPTRYENFSFPGSQAFVSFLLPWFCFLCFLSFSPSLSFSYFLFVSFLPIFFRFPFFLSHLFFLNFLFLIPSSLRVFFLPNFLLLLFLFFPSSVMFYLSLLSVDPIFFLSIVYNLFQISSFPLPWHSFLRFLFDALSTIDYLFLFSRLYVYGISLYECMFASMFA